MKYNTQQVSEALANAYARLMAYTLAHFKAIDAQTIADRALDEAKQRVLLAHADDPKALGSNEAARKAKIDELTAAELAAVRAAEDGIRKARADQEMARIEVDHYRAQLRCLEVEVGATEAEARGFIARV